MRLIFGLQTGYLEYYIGGKILVDLFTKNRTDSYTRDTSGQRSNQMCNLKAHVNYVKMSHLNSNAVVTST